MGDFKNAAGGKPPGWPLFDRTFRTHGSYRSNESYPACPARRFAKPTNSAFSKVITLAGQKAREDYSLGSENIIYYKGERHGVNRFCNGFQGGRNVMVNGKRRFS
jgi:hypothetical protein